MKLKKTYNGLVVPSITPLTENHKLDHKAVEKIFDNFSILGGMPFIWAPPARLPRYQPDLKIDFIKLSAKLKQPEKMLYAGISSNCVAESVEMAKRCADEGVDAVVAHLPAYFDLTPHEIKKYFETLADMIPAAADHL
jgi:dihydrodipicolinate synthase/N-acetylneuraminate lyase